MTPSIELRNMAAELHEAMTKAEDVYRDGRDHGEELAVQGWLAEMECDARNAYDTFGDRHGFHLRTDASGLFLRCAETGIPLVIGDEYDELETGECVLVKRAA